MFLSHLAPQPSDPDWDLAAESIAVKIRWFGLVAGVVIAFVGYPANGQSPLYAILLLGLGYTGLDTYFFARGRVFLRDYPLVIAAMESLFISLLCHFETGLDSPFRFYYLLSVICCAIRFSQIITFAACGLHCLSYGMLYLAQPEERRNVPLLALTIIVLVWVSWAASAMARLLKIAGERLRMLNAELRDNQGQLESRIAERTRDLQEIQAQVLHQEKMAAFGLLAAGIAHEVGNPLTSISSLVQMLERRDQDPYTREKLGQVGGQLVRIQAILRELVLFSRPASGQRGKVSVAEIIDEALGIAKYYRGGKTRTIASDLAPQLPLIVGVRDQLVQVVFNLVLNAIDATGKGGRIDVRAEIGSDGIQLCIADDGCGIPPDSQSRLFRPYFTTKKHGTGLGLFVTQKIVVEHGGTVAFDSEPGRGTTFRILLPVPQMAPLVPVEA